MNIAVDYLANDMDEYRAKGLLRNGHVNTVLASSSLRKRVVGKRCADFLRHDYSRIIETPEGVRLKVKFNLHEKDEAREPVILTLHGWNGCSDSIYVLSLGEFLFGLGYDVVRVNFRDHGGTEPLNPELFHSCRLREVIDTAHAVQTKLNGRPLIVVGFSLGGNFALRMAATNTTSSLAKVIGVCPILEPASTLKAMERSPRVYEYYFMQRWRESLAAKARAFPERYDEKEFEKPRTCRDMTAYLVERYTEYQALHWYLRGYSVTRDVLGSLRAESHILVSSDDPLVPLNDLERLAKSHFLHIRVTRHGGHCGFLNNRLDTPWLHRFIIDRIEA